MLARGSIGEGERHSRNTATRHPPDRYGRIQDQVVKVFRRAARPEGGSGRRNFRNWIFRPVEFELRRRFSIDGGSETIGFRGIRGIRAELRTIGAFRHDRLRRG